MNQIVPKLTIIVSGAFSRAQQMGAVQFRKYSQQELDAIERVILEGIEKELNPEPVRSFMRRNTTHSPEGKEYES